MLGFAQEGKRCGGHTCWELVAGEGPDEDLGTWLGRRRRWVSRRRQKERRRERKRARTAAREREEPRRESQAAARRGEREQLGFEDRNTLPPTPTWFD